MAELTLNTNTITDMGELARLAYLEYGTSIKIGDEYFGSTNITDTETGAVETFHFNSRYTVIETTSSLTSMDAVLLKNEDTGKYVIVFRGTQEYGDVFTDLLIGVTSALTGTITAYNNQYSAANTFVQNILNNPDYNITLSNLTLTGHSLGGILAQTIASENALSAYTFNALGTSGLTRFNDTNGSKILNFSYTDDGILNGDILSNALSFLGNDHLGEVIPMFGPNAGAVAHTMDYMSMVIDVYNNILKSFDSTTDYRDISQGFRSNINISENSSGDTFTKTIEYLSEVGIYETGVSGLKYNFLSDMTASQIESKATNNRAAMFALLKLNGFAVEGNLTAYADMNLAKYSEKYIEKRSLFLYHLLDPDNRDLGDIYIKDQGYGISAGSSGFFSDNPKIIFGYDRVNQGYNENLIGGSKDDYLFGMDGNDILIGEEGNDYLEGGQGSDILVGGENYDTYVVDNGDQVYDSDGRGEIIFNNYVLEGGQIIAGTDNQYEGINGEYYVLEGSILTVYDNSGNSVVINSFNKDKNNLNIVLDDNPQAPTEDIIVTVTNAYLSESGNEMVFTVSLNTELNKEISHMESYTDANGDVTQVKVVDVTAETLRVSLSTQDGNAVAGVDYESVGDVVLTFTAGEPIVQTFSVAILDDSIKEINHTFELVPEIFSYTPSMKYPSGTAIPRTTAVSNPAVGTILDDDTQAVVIDIVGFSAHEGSESGHQIKSQEYTLKLSNELKEDIYITLSKTTENGNVVYSNLDELEHPDTLLIKIPAGSTSIPINYAWVTDSFENPDLIERISISSISYSGSEIVEKGDDGIITILDDDAGCQTLVDFLGQERFDFQVEHHKDEPLSIIYDNDRGTGWASNQQADELPPVAYDNWSCYYNGSSPTNLATGAGRGTSPLILDLNANGYTSISLAASSALFDYQGNGFLEKTAWAEADDGILAIDLNGDGIINDGSEIFGDNTKLSDGSLAKDGYEALTQYDSNNDSVIDVNDTKFSELSIWKDVNQNGVTDTGELVSLSEQGISSINLVKTPDSTFEKATENGNYISEQTTFTMNNQSYIMNDVWFQARSLQENLQDVYFDMDGNGFKEKMVTWSDPREFILVQDKNNDGIISDGTEIINEKTVLSDGNLAGDSYTAMRDLDTNFDGVLDANDTSGISLWTDENHNGLTDLGELVSLADSNLDRIELNPYQTLLSGYDKNSDGKIDENDAIYDLIYRKINDDGSVTLYLPDNEIARKSVEKYNGNEKISTENGEVIVKNIVFYDKELDLEELSYGTNQNDHIVANLKDNKLYGRDGRDIIDAKEGNDIIEGGRGGDLLKGGSGNDTYVFNRGDGFDMIDEENRGGIDTLEFTGDISKDDLMVSLDGDNLVIALKEDGVSFNELSDKIIIKNFNSTSYIFNAIENFSFENGDTFTADEVIALSAIHGTNNSDILIGTEENEIFYAQKGNDVLDGDKGNDTYHYDLGDGKDTILENGGIDKIVFGEGITKDNIQLEIRKDEVEELQINTTKGWSNTEHSMTVLDDGSYVITWGLWEENSGIQNIYMQKFSADGTGVGDEVKITTDADGFTNSSDIVSLDNGNILVTWNYWGKESIQGQIFDLNINAVGDRFDISTPSYSYNVNVTSLSNGNLVSTWHEYGTDGSGNGVFAQKLDSTGVKIGDKFQVNTYSYHSQDDVSTTTLNDGGFVVTWNSDGQDGSKYGVFAQKFDSNGDRVGNEFQVNTTTKDWQEEPSVISFENGDFLIAWSSTPGEETENGIYAQRYDSNANKLGAEFQIDTYSYGYQQNPSIASLADGGFIATWDSSGQNGAEHGVFAQRFDLNGVKVGDEFQVHNSAEGIYQSSPEVISFDDGGFAISWKNEADDVRFMLKRYDSNGEVIPVSGEYTENFVISFSDNVNDEIIIKNISGRSLIETLEFSDGTIIESKDFDAQIGVVGLNGSKILESQEIYGTDEADILSGGLGNDLIYGGAGDDTYIFNLESGHDTIADDSGVDTIQFSDGISKEDLLFSKNGNTLLIGIKELDKPFSELRNVLGIENAFDVSKSIENFSFSNGEVLSLAELESFGVFDGDDYIVGTSLDDTLTGGEGDDFLVGEAGNDTYIFNKGDGHDTIYDSSGIDKIIFGPEVEPMDIVAHFEGNDFVLGINENGVNFSDLQDKIYIINYKNLYSRKEIEYIDFANGISLDKNGILQLQGTNESDNITVTSGQDINAKEGNDTLVNEGGIARGGAGDDTLIAASYAEGTFSGDEGNDTITGSYKSNIYLFNRGDGHDIIFDDSLYSNSSDIDRLIFGSDISSDNLLFRKEGDNLKIYIKEDAIAFENLQDSVEIKNFYVSRSGTANYRIERFEFNNGSTVLTWQDMAIFMATEGDDVISAMGTSIALNIDALSGNDIINGSDRNDTLFGNTGNDTINAGRGYDTLDGGQGNDILSGGTDNDTYIFNLGDGQDVINEESGNDTIKFGEGVFKDDLVLQREGNNIVFSNNTNNDTVTIQDWFSSSNKIVERIYFYGENAIQFDILANTLNDAESISLSEIDFYLADSGEEEYDVDYIGSEKRDVFVSSYSTDTVNGGGGNDIISTGSNDDTLEGSDGDDLLYGGYGNDNYIYNKGDGHDTIYDEGSYSVDSRWSEERLEEDILKFTDVNDISELIVELNGNDLIIGIKEGTTPLSELSATITVKSWLSDYNSNTVESIQLADGTMYNISDTFGIALQGEPISSAGPIIFDLNGNGLTSTSIEESNTYFDYNGDGQREHTAWAEKDDAILAVDLNDDGKINDGSELFGDYTKLPDGTTAADGYEALEQYDSNNDGVIDASDEKFSDLLLWKDSDQDGKTDDGELATLTQSNITSISLNTDNVTAFESIDENGNIITNETNYTSSTEDGIVRDVWFKYDENDNVGHTTEVFTDIVIENKIQVDSTQTLGDTEINQFILESRYTGDGDITGVSGQTQFISDGFIGTVQNKWYEQDILDTIYEFDGEVSDAISVLPNAEGVGSVRDLQHVLSEDELLTNDVDSFQNNSSELSLEELEKDMDSILGDWALADSFSEEINSTPPIVVDLNKNGITSTSLENSDAYFDYDGNGRREHTSWIESGDAILAVDLNSNGKIDDGSELFGKYTKLPDETIAKDGYEALAQYDSNGDSIINSSDMNFSTLSLWKDINQDGKSSEDELSSLSDNDITSINLDIDGNYIEVQENGNAITNETNYTQAGEDGLVRDIWFKYNENDSIAVSELSDSDEKKIAVVEAFTNNTLSSEDRKNPYVLKSVFNQYNILKYDTMAKFISNKLFGQEFPDCKLMYIGLNNTLSRIVAGESSQSEINLAVNLLSALVKRDKESTLKGVEAKYFENATIANILELNGVVIEHENGEFIGQVGNEYHTSSTDDIFDFTDKNSVQVFAKDGNDQITGSKGRDYLVGGEGNDIIVGNGGTDILDGGKGHDTLIGSTDQNLYVYQYGEGHDTILDTGNKEDKPDILHLKNIQLEDLKIEHIGHDMVISVRGHDGTFENNFGSITIKNGYSTGAIEEFYFDNAIYTLNEMLAITASDSSYYYFKGMEPFTLSDAGGIDKIIFSADINRTNLLTKQDGNDLIIGVSFEDREIEDLPNHFTIKDFFISENQIESFEFSDGIIFDATQILTLPLAEDNYIYNRTPIIVEQGTEYTFANNVNQSGIVLAYDMDGDNISYTVSTQGDNGILEINSLGLWTYQANEGYVGSDSVLITISDGKGGVAIQPLNFTVTEHENENDAPVTVATEAFILQDVREQTGEVEASDVDGDTLSFSVTTAAEHGILSIDETGAWIYSIDGYYMGEDSAIITVDDGNGGTATKTLTFDARVTTPSLVDATANLLEDNPTEGTFNVVNPIGGVLTYRSYNFNSKRRLQY